MEDVGAVARPVRDAAVRQVLALEDEAPEPRAVDPVVRAEHAQHREDPPRVADVGLLLRPPVEPPAVALALREPPAEQRAVHQVQAPRDRQRAHAAEDLARVRLGAGRAAVAAVEVPARVDERRRPPDVGVAEPPEERQRRQRAVREARVDLAPAVAAEGAVRLLERGDVRRRRGAVAPVQRAEQRQDLQRRQRVEHVRVVPPRAAEAAVGVLAAPRQLDQRRPAQLRRRVPPEEPHRRQAPVHAAHAHVLRQGVLQGARVRGHPLEVGGVAFGREGRRRLRRVVERRVGERRRGLVDGGAHRSWEPTALPIDWIAPMWPLDRREMQALARWRANQWPGMSETHTPRVF